MRDVVSHAMRDDGYIHLPFTADEIESQGKFSVCADWVLIRRDDDDSQSKIVHLVVKNRKHRAITGVVVQTGKYRRLTSPNPVVGPVVNGKTAPYEVAIGDGVLFHVLAGHDIMSSDNQRYVCCVEDDIFLVFDSPEDRFMIEGFSPKKQQAVSVKQKYTA